MSDTTQGDQVEQFDDERDEGTPEKGSPEKEPGTVLDLVANPPEAPGRGLLAAAAQVPVKVHGAAPENFANQVTIAQYMAKARLMVPAHFHDNVGDCLAIIDIATRAGLSPYMVAAKTYKDPAGRGVAFESQLYHAFLIGSGWLKDAALHVKYEGTGADRTCTISGTLKGEDTPRTYTTPPLGQLHPGYSLATQDGSTRTKKKLTYAEGQAFKANPEGKGFLSVAGSPLWDDKPDVQMFYDGSRDFGRMFAPIATLGMLAQYETIEHPIAPPAGDSGDALRQRLANGNKSEGHQPGFAERELAQVASDAGTIKPAGDDIDKKGRAAALGEARRAEKTVAKAKPPTKAEQKAAAAKASAKAAADRAQATSDKNKKPTVQKTDDPKPTVPLKPKNAAEYEVYCEDWINRTSDPEAAKTRWDKEREMRDDLTVRTKNRNRLRELLEKKGIVV